MSNKYIYHPLYGNGIIEQTRNKGFELYILFENGIKRWIRIDEIILKEKKDSSNINKNVSKITQSNNLSNETFRNRRMIEAFRLGIVPYDCVDEFTFGRDEDIKRILNLLQHEKNNNLILIGEYGTGKTHLLHYAMGKALKSGFAVSWVEMDPNEAPFHNPKLIYKKIVRNFKYISDSNGQINGFRELLQNTLNKGYFKDHFFFKYLIKHNDELYWEWIEGNYSFIKCLSELNDYNFFAYLPNLYDYSSAANIYCYLLSSLGWAAKNVLGLKGLLLIFDEAETLLMKNYTSQAEKGKNFFNALCRTANNDINLCKSPSFSNLIYCRVGIFAQIPFLYRVPCGLKTLFAFTCQISDNSKTNSAILLLNHIPENILFDIFKKICDIYAKSYNLKISDEIINKLFDSTKVHTRLFVKTSIEKLDLFRFNNKII